ncbi:MAG: type II secretion system protein [Legionella sp.]|nr:type II secretion system protein [Legionella sp.]
MRIHTQKGFTMIELVMVIVILGILAAVAIPRFIDLQSNAQQAAIDGLAGGLGTASSVNYAGCSATGNTVTAGKCVNVAACAGVGSLVKPALSLAVGTSTEGTYNLLAAGAVATNGSEATCTLQIKKNGTDYTSTYIVTGAGN